MPESYLITTPIYYVNDKPHIGHAYSTILADIMARWQRLAGLNVYFTTGTDEHGAKVAQVARQNKKTPKRFVDEQVLLYKDAWQKYGISNDDFVRTTESRHEQAVELFLRQLKASNTVYEGTYQGLYCVGCEAFVDPGDLQDGKCLHHNREPEVVKEKNWFFRLSDFADVLLDKIKNEEIQICPDSKRKEILSFIERGLKDISISRENQPWGIALPFDPKQTIYVWVDALINYLTVAGYPNEKGKLETYWPTAHHIVGKDIMRFHCIIWPALLMAVGLKPPQQIFVHGFFTVNGQKMSKTLGNVISPEDLLTRFGSDGARYTLVRQMVPGEDTDITLEKLMAIYNSELKNGIGNLMARLSTLATKASGFAFVVPPDHEGVALVKKSWQDYRAALADFHLSAALDATQSLIAYANRAVNDTKPWTIERPDELAVALAPLLEVVRHIGLQLLPFTPKTGSIIVRHLGDKLPGELLPGQLAAFQSWHQGALPVTPVAGHLFS